MTEARPHVLLTGGTGYLGHYLVGEIRARGLRLSAAGRRGGTAGVDLADSGAIDGALRAARPDLILNAAALSRLSGCEEDPELAQQVNATAVRWLSASGARLLQVSTDMVFDGRGAPYSAGDPPAPLGVYGRTKVAGENAALDAGQLVVRLPLLFGPSFDGRRGATDMIRASDRVQLYSNEFRTPLHVADAARLLVDLLLEPDVSGVLQLAGPERVSRHELGRRFAEVAGLPEDRLAAAQCDDPRRPGDLSLVSDRDCGRTLDEALRDS